MTNTFLLKGVQFLFFIGVLCMFAPSASAAILYFDPDEVTLYRGDTATIALRINVDEGECINTADAVIHYGDSVRAVDISRGDSIFSLWIQDPIIDEKAHTISFAGGIPGGYCGRIPGDPSLTNVVLKLIFRSPGLSIGSGAKESETARVWIDEQSQVLLHDGLGTNAKLTLQETTIILKKVPGPDAKDSWKEEIDADIQRPSDFSITLVKDEFAFSGRYFITFNATDKQSGIDHYEIMEEPFSEFYTFKWGAATAPWIRAESPYVLRDQTLNSTIRVKAIDKAGNERIEVYVPDEAQRSISRDRLLSLIVGGVILVFIISLTVYALWRREQRLLRDAENTHE